MKIAEHRQTFMKMNGLKVKKISFWPYLTGKIRHVFCQFGIHKGKVFTKGYIKVMGKRNKPETISKEVWNVRRCQYCFEIFSKPEDCDKN